MIMPDHLENEFLEFINKQKKGPKDNYDWTRLVQLAFIAGHNVVSIEDNEDINPVI